MAITKTEVQHYLKKCSTTRLESMGFFIETLLWDRDEKILGMTSKKATKKAPKKVALKANKSNSNYLSPLQGYGN
jgi:hypothetical protein